MESTGGQIMLGRSRHETAVVLCTDTVGHALTCELQLQQQHW
jgi:hypothetical protein